MRSASSATQSALTQAPDKGIIPRDLFWIVCKDRSTGNPVSRGFWSGDRNIEIDVISGVTGLPETRTYYGGVNLNVGDIPRGVNLQIESVPVSFSAIADLTKEMIRLHDPRLARCEVHYVELDPDTREPVDDAEIAFLGMVDSAPSETGARDGDSTFDLSIVSEAIAMLSLTNPRKRSYEGQKRRDGDDEFGLYSSTIRQTRIYWGERKIDHDSAGNG